jgi:predicted dehydrogenase
VTGGVTAVVDVAIVGCAHRPHAWSYARALASSASARLVGVFDEDPALGHSVADDFGAPWTDDLDSLLRTDGLEAVVVCSPTVQHRGHVAAAAAAGLHVLCEKPLATTADDGLAAVAACRETGVQLHVAFVSRFLPHVRSVKHTMDSGALGDVVGLRAGNRGRPPLPPSYPAWITRREDSGGGALIDHSVHLTDLVRHLTGREVTQVAAETGTLLWGAGVEDCALLSLVLEGGAVAGLDPSWSVPANNPWDYDFFLRLVGTAGSVDLDDLAESVRVVSSGTGDGLRLAGFAEDPDAAMIENFCASVRAGEPLAPAATGEDGLRALDVALAAYASSAAGARFVAPGSSGSPVSPGSPAP